jgi:hypothetical protein
MRRFSILIDSEQPHGVTLAYRSAWSKQKGKPRLQAMQEYVILVDETFEGFAPGQEQSGGLEAPTTSTLAGAQQQRPEEARFWPALVHMSTNVSQQRSCSVGAWTRLARACTP